MAVTVVELKTKADFDRAIADNSKLILVDFYADWCPPCRNIAPTIMEFAETYAEKLVCFKVNVDENEETAKAEKISAMPTFKFYKNGVKVDELVGASQEKLVEIIERHK